MSVETERLRIKTANLRLNVRAHTEGTVLNRYPLSKTVGIRFDGGKCGLVREDDLEPIPVADTVAEIDADAVGKTAEEAA